MLKVSRVFKPDGICILGDFADMESLSAHLSDSPTRWTLNSERVAVSVALNQLDELGATRKVYVQGNHEFRFERYVAQNAPQLFDQISWREMFDLDRRGWEFVPYRKSTRIGKLNVTHDVGSAGMNAARSATQKFMGSAVIGHIHRMFYEVRGRLGRTPYLAASFGWLGDPAAATYLHAAAAAEWVHGFGIGYEDESTGVVHTTPVPIIDGQCVVEGRLYSATCLSETRL